MFAQKAIIINDGKVLLIQKSGDDSHNPWRWETPGGRLQDGETLDEHLQREVKEEVGLDIVTGRPLAVWSWTMGNSPDAPTVVAITRECILTPGVTTQISFANQVADDYIAAWEWVPIDRVADYDLIDNYRAPLMESIRIS